MIFKIEYIPTSEGELPLKEVEVHAINMDDALEYFNEKRLGVLTAIERIDKKAREEDD